jgi:SOS response regulatory protein OraA/RecX
MSRKTVNRIRLENLYTSKETYQTVYKFMESVFEQKFKTLIENAKEKKPFLVEPALLMKTKIKRYFIEFGYEMEEIWDIERLLRKFKIFSGPNCKYAQARNSFYGYQ